MPLVLKLFHYYKNLIWESRRWVFVIIIVFVVGILAGVFTSQMQPEVAKKLIVQYSDSIDKSLKPGWETTRVIFSRNVLVVLLSMISSVILGFVAILVTFVNGFVLGVIVGFKEIYTKINAWQLFLLLFPHGIVEYFGFFLGLGFGVRLGLNWLLPTNKNLRFKTLKKNIAEAVTVLILVVFILGIAALIEGFLTIKIACFLGGICNRL